MFIQGVQAPLHGAEESSGFDVYDAAGVDPHPSTRGARGKVGTESVRHTDKEQLNFSDGRVPLLRKDTLSFVA
jgi:hypothetical protein